MRNFRVGARGIAEDALARMAGFGVDILRRNPLPDFPRGCTLPLSLDYGGLGDEPHCCQREPGVVTFPGGFVVFDVVVPAQYGNRYRTRERFCPFFTGEVRITHEGTPIPDPSIWNPIRGAAAAICGIAQNPWMGSIAFRTALPNDDLIAEAYVLGGQIVVGWSHNARHHVAYVRKAAVPHWYWQITESQV